MVGLGILIGHLVGDYILQNDWQAANKTTPHPGPRPGGYPVLGRLRFGFLVDPVADPAWQESRRKWWIGHLACTVHCLLYTLSVFLLTWPVHLFPWWVYAGVGLIHWPVDRFRLAGRWMRQLSGQYAFATGPLSPWSIIVVDNTFHLVTAYLLAVDSL